MIGASCKLCVDGVGVWSRNRRLLRRKSKRLCGVCGEGRARRERREERERGGLNEILGDEHTSGGALEV